MHFLELKIDFDVLISIHSKYIAQHLPYYIHIYTTQTAQTIAVFIKHNFKLFIHHRLINLINCKKNECSEISFMRRACLFCFFPLLLLYDSLKTWVLSNFKTMYTLFFLLRFGLFFFFSASTMTNVNVYCGFLLLLFIYLFI